MTTVKTSILPNDEAGNDPNDHRYDSSYLKRLETLKKKPSMDWVDGFILTDEEAAMISDPQWIYPNLIIQGHVIAIPAPPNGGKTTIFMWLASQIATDYHVYYVNADVSGGDAKKMILDANKFGYDMLLPDMKVGLSMDNVVKNLEEMNEANADYSEVIFIFDTLKKMTDVINKSKAKQLYKTFRGLSGKGMTIILLGHTNKYDDKEGRPIYEGTGDLRADVDELIYLIPKKNDDGSMTVSTNPDKVRGSFKPITFTISAEREVFQSEEYVDVAKIQKVTCQQEQDEPAIEAISDALQSGKTKQIEIITHCKNYSIGKRTVANVLKRYQHPPVKLWSRNKGFQNNTWLYQLCTPPEQVAHVTTGVSETTGAENDQF